MGLNLPWVDCGHDFGEEPPAWGGAPRPGRFAGLGEALAPERAAGLELLRFWVLGGGKNYPVGERPGARFDVIEERRRRLGGRLPGWIPPHRDQHFRLPTGENPPGLTVAFLEDFAAFLQEVASAGLRAWPVLLSFEAFFPIEFQGGVLGQGRGPVILGDAWQGGGPAAVDAFLDAVLEPLLERCEDHREHIAAFELVNEPEWAVRGGPIHARLHAGGPRVMPKTVAAEAMGAFLERGIARIVRRGFVSSIGFKQGDPRWLPPSLHRALGGAAAAGSYIHQHHYYPSLYEPEPLPEYDELPFRPCYVGEMPTRRFPLFGPMAMAWLDAPARLRQHLDPERYLQERLDVIASRGYPAALLWSRNGDDEMCAWGDAQRDQVRRFLQP